MCVCVCVCVGIGGYLSSASTELRAHTKTPAESPPSNLTLLGGVSKLLPLSSDDITIAEASSSSMLEDLGYPIVETTKRNNYESKARSKVRSKIQSMVQSTAQSRVQSPAFTATPIVVVLKRDMKVSEYVEITG